MKSELKNCQYWIEYYPDLIFCFSPIVPNSLTTDESASNSDNENSEQLLEKCDLHLPGQEKINEKPEEEPSLNLFLEPDTEKLTDEETDNSIPNSDELILNR